MNIELELPPDVEKRLCERASSAGQDVSTLVRAAVVRFVEEDRTPIEGEWDAGRQLRRRELIDRDIAGTISPSERLELEQLDRQANAHFDRVAPPPMIGARELHERLLRRRADNP